MKKRDPARIADWISRPCSIIAAMADSSSKPSRRWLRLSLRSLLFLVVVISVPLAWKVNRAHNQRRVVAKLTSLGAQVIWSFQQPGAKDPPEPQWLRRLLGDHFFFDVHHVDTSGATEDVILEAAALPNLKSLYVDSDALTDDGIANLARISDVETLSLRSTNITDTGLERLTGLKNLKHLILSGPQFTATGLSHLAKLRQLEYLSLNGTKLNDEVCAILFKLSRLTTLQLGDLEITHAQLERLSELSQLRTFALVNTNSGDSGLAHLERMSNLKMLWMWLASRGCKRVE